MYVSQIAQVIFILILGSGIWAFKYFYLDSIIPETKAFRVNSINEYTKYYPRLFDDPIIWNLSWVLPGLVLMLPNSIIRHLKDYNEIKDIRFLKTILRFLNEYLRYVLFVMVVQTLHSITRAYVFYPRPTFVHDCDPTGQNISINNEVWIVSNFTCLKNLTTLELRDQVTGFYSIDSVLFSGIMSYLLVYSYTKIKKGFPFARYLRMIYIIMFFYLVWEISFQSYSSNRSDLFSITFGFGTGLFSGSWMSWFLNQGRLFDPLRLEFKEKLRTVYSCPLKTVKVGSDY